MENGEPTGNRPLSMADVVVVEDVVGEGIEDLSQRWSLRSDHEAWSDPERLRSLTAGARALVVRNRAQVTAALLRSAPCLQVVARAGVGLDNIDLHAADELGIVVVAAVGANARSVAEHALALSLALARDVVGHHSRLRDGGWDRAPGIELAGRTWGVVGLGATGRSTAELAGAFGMPVVGHDPFLAPGPVAGVRRVDTVEEVLAAADVVSLHLAASAQTRELVDAGFLGAMRPGALLINVARGELVDEDALVAALDDGTIAGAGLDVRVVEPPGPGGLSAHPRVVCTPHVAGITSAAQRRVVGMIAADVDRVLSGDEPLHPVGRYRRPRGGGSRAAKDM